VAGLAPELDHRRKCGAGVVRATSVRPDVANTFLLQDHRALPHVALALFGGLSEHLRSAVLHAQRHLRPCPASPHLEPAVDKEEVRLVRSCERASVLTKVHALPLFQAHSRGWRTRCPATAPDREAQKPFWHRPTQAPGEAALWRARPAKLARIVLLLERQRPGECGGRLSVAHPRRHCGCRPTFAAAQHAV
jgi:hypothetical protein